MFKTINIHVKQDKSIQRQKLKICRWVTLTLILGVVRPCRAQNSFRSVTLRLLAKVWYMVHDPTMRTLIIVHARLFFFKENAPLHDAYWGLHDYFFRVSNLLVVSTAPNPALHLKRNIIFMGLNDIIDNVVVSSHYVLWSKNFIFLYKFPFIMYQLYYPGRYLVGLPIKIPKNASIDQDFRINIIGHHFV